MNKIYRLFSTVLLFACLAIPHPAMAAPADVSADAPTGKKLVISVTASGSDPLSYQWFKAPLDAPTAFVAIPGAQSANALIILAVATSDSGVYRVTISNAAGSIDSPTATVKVISSPAVVSFTVTVSSP